MTHTGNFGDFCAMVIMAKASIPGACKTRLVPPLTPEEAAQVNTRFLEDIGAHIAAAAHAAPIRGYATCTPSGADSFFQSVLPAGFQLVHPPVDGLAFALSFAARTLLESGYRSVCMVNGDSPNLPTPYLVNAAMSLRESAERLVLGPATDGGYYLIGMNRWHARLFEDIAWSTAIVAEQTVARAREAGYDVMTLPPWYDVDDRESLQHLAAEVLDGGDAAGAPHAAALLRELRAAGRIAAATAASERG